MHDNYETPNLSPSDPHLQRHNLSRKIIDRLSAQSLTRFEAFIVLFGRLDTVKRVLAKAQRRFIADGLRLGFKIADLAATDGRQAPPAPPASSLSYLNRSTIYPTLVPAEPSVIAVGLSLPEITAAVREAKANGVPPHQLLDLFVSASGLAWSNAAHILLTQEVIPQPIDPADIDATKAARRFWQLYFNGQLEYEAAVRLDQVPNWAGDWGLFSIEALDCLLPGLVLPDHCQRAEFLTRYITTEQPALAIYSFTGMPLCTHPFPPRCNPLTYGKAPAIELQP